MKGRKNQMLLQFSEFCAFFLICRNLYLPAWSSILIGLLAAVLLRKNAERDSEEKIRSSFSWILLAILCYLMANLGRIFLYQSKFLSDLSGSIGVPLVLCAIGTAFLIGICAFPGLRALCAQIFSPSSQQSHSSSSRPDRKTILVLFLISLVAISLFSKSSPLYPFNDWEDSNCFMTVGKGILAGKVPYRDYIEQKGPYLYFLHAAAALVSFTSFTGVWIIEVVTMWVSMCYAYRIIRLYTDASCLYLFPLAAALICGTECFSHGDSAEELMMPFLCFSMFIFLRYLKQNHLPSFAEAVSVGISAGIILWTKFSFLGFYLGSAIVPVIVLLKKKQGRELLILIGEILLGIGIATFPVVLYFGMNHAWNDLVQIYFMDNLFHYDGAAQHSAGFNMAVGIFWSVFKNPIYFTGIAAGMLEVSRKHAGSGWYLLLSFIVTCVTVYPASFYRMYYALIFAVFCWLMIIPLSEWCCRLAQALTEKKFGIAVPILETAGIAALFLNCNNRYLFLQDRSVLPQYKFREEILSTESHSLLNYGFLDGGFYTVTGIVPDFRMFCELNFSVPEFQNLQDEYLSSGQADYVVTCDHEIPEDSYELIDTAVFRYESHVYTYRLYRRRGMVS